MIILFGIFIALPCIVMIIDGTIRDLSIDRPRSFFLNNLMCISNILTPIIILVSAVIAFVLLLFMALKG